MEFDVQGPFEIDRERISKGKYRLIFDDFWSGKSKNLDAISEKRGVYLFAAKAGKGYTPLYVGKATKNFAQEVFNRGNKHLFSDAMLEYQRCKPVMFFVVSPKRQGKASSIVIDEVETFLIQSAYAKNPGIQNVKKTRMPSWSIRGVVRNSKGGAPVRANEFRKAMGL